MSEIKLNPEIQALYDALIKDEGESFAPKTAQDGPEDAAPASAGGEGDG